MENKYEMKEADLNLYDAMNSKAVVNAKDGVPVLNNQDKNLKGALGLYNGTFDVMLEFQWVKTFMEQLFELQAMNFEYKNLPEELNIFRIEYKPFRNGSSAWIKLNGKIYVVNYSIVEFNMYEEPTQIKIVEPKAKPLNNRIFKVGKDCQIFRNNSRYVSSYVKVFRYVKAMERTLFQIEKNLLASAPKGILNLKNNVLNTGFQEPNEAPMKNSMENIINGQDTFYTMKGGKDGYDPLSPEEELFTPIELTDRTDSLITNYTFFKEQIKELMGKDINIHQKKERAITGEIDQQQGISQMTLQAMINIRKIDIENINREFGTNITVELVKPEQLEQEENEKDGEENDI